MQKAPRRRGDDGPVPARAAGRDLRYASNARQTERGSKREGSSSRRGNPRGSIGFVADVLFVASGIRRWGAFDSGTGEVDLHNGPDLGDGDLLDFAAVLTIVNGGVYVTGQDDIPGGADAASVSRYQ